MLDKEVGPPGNMANMEYLAGVLKLLNLDMSTVSSEAASDCFVGPEGAAPVALWWKEG
jgi:hypothetical protein